MGGGKIVYKCTCEIAHRAPPFDCWCALIGVFIIRQCLQKCRDIEAAIINLEKQSLDTSYFPVTIRRYTTFSLQINVLDGVWLSTIYDIIRMYQYNFCSVVDVP